MKRQIVNPSIHLYKIQVKIKHKNIMEQMKFNFKVSGTIGVTSKCVLMATARKYLLFFRSKIVIASGLFWADEILFITFVA